MIFGSNLFKGMSLLSLLISLMAFSGIFLTVNQWTSYQRKSAVEIYQRYQAIQIAENQKQRQFLGLDCENTVSQNGIRFQVQCGVPLIVRYPAGEIRL